MDTRPFVKRNASIILTVLGSIGVVATTITAVKATPKVLRLIEEAETKKGEKTNKMGNGKNSEPVIYFDGWTLLSYDDMHYWCRSPKLKKTSIFTKCMRSIRSVLQRLLKNTKFA